MDILDRYTVGPTRIGHLPLFHLKSTIDSFEVNDNQTDGGIEEIGTVENWEHSIASNTDQISNDDALHMIVQQNSMTQHIEDVGPGDEEYTKASETPLLEAHQDIEDFQQESSIEEISPMDPKLNLSVILPIPPIPKRKGKRSIKRTCDILSSEIHLSEMLESESKKKEVERLKEERKVNALVKRRQRLEEEALKLGKAEEKVRSASTISLKRPFSHLQQYSDRFTSIAIDEIPAKKKILADKENQPMSELPCTSTKKPKIVCCYCQRLFAYEKGVKKHENECDKNPDQIVTVCEDCGATIKPSSLNAHKKMHVQQTNQQ